MNGLSALIKEMPESSLALFPSCEDMRRGPFATHRRAGPHQNQTMLAL